MAKILPQKKLLVKFSQIIPMQKNILSNGLHFKITLKACEFREGCYQILKLI